MGKFLRLSPELWPLIDVILCSYIELIFRGGVSCLPAALLFTLCNGMRKYKRLGTTNVPTLLS